MYTYYSQAHIDSFKTFTLTTYRHFRRTHLQHTDTYRIKTHTLESVNNTDPMNNNTQILSTHKKVLNRYREQKEGRWWLTS